MTAPDTFAATGRVDFRVDDREPWHSDETQNHALRCSHDPNDSDNSLTEMGKVLGEQEAHGRRISQSVRGLEVHERAGIARLERRARP